MSWTGRNTLRVEDTKVSVYAVGEELRTEKFHGWRTSSRRVLEESEVVQVASMIASSFGRLKPTALPTSPIHSIR